ncbi:SGNH/GDSL hydrolase family protein [Lysobacter ciconiae]|uniref:SGNH/GDSL hydrolase family protein n=1 Tax=Novilysobacter ciconiae TaxID=2781022 RepID=A0A7S6UFF8_9GAMM|nr:SGNH/GDSL hydrolase family protein [Lysobacter ciconiae]QOW19260.1 SGNH/GDSL hydrolase family protein [Lysobacter ciconiae]
MEAPTSDALSWLALGDSYTIGEGVAEDGRWPELLVERLVADGFPVGRSRVIATTGWTTDELSTAMDLAEPLGRWELVSLLIGVNNQYRGRSVADYRGEFQALLKRAIALAGDRPDRVLVLSIPDWGVTAFATAQGRDAEQIAAEIDQYNAAAADLCARHGVAFVDITPLSRERGGDVAMLVDDGLHPSQAMYALWAEAALPVVEQMLGARPDADQKILPDAGTGGTTPR